MRNLILKAFFYLLIIPSMLTSCNSQTLKDIYENENLPLEIEGKVLEIILYKGGNISLNIEYKNGNTKEIAVAKNINDYIKNGDYFIKEKNSNKCSIIRNDSIIYLDCYDIPSDVRNSIKDIKEWPKNKTKKWRKIK